MYYYYSMNLITVLIALGVEFWLGGFDRYRNLSWFVRYSDWLGGRLAGIAWWQGPCGLLLTLFIPLATLAALVYLADEVSFLLGFLLSFLVLVYSFGPALGARVDSYTAALGNADEAAAEQILAGILYDQPEDGAVAEQQVLAALMLRAHEYLFAVVFWFLLLGAVGALLYCLVVNLALRHEPRADRYADAVRALHRILMWPSARLLALGFALGGSLVSALDSWRTVSGHTLASSRDVITRTGLGALNYEPTGIAAQDNDNADFISRIKDTMGLINRTLIVWLIVLGLMTIAGWIG